jgi:class 3 adenylate cyclase/tetratricopeptide (TPR) repeat protein
MDIDLLSAYLPVDRRHALAAGHPLLDRAQGAVLFADIAGFTPLAESLASALGPRRGAEELTRLLNAVYDALIFQVHRYGGSVIGFSGDGFVGWFDGDPGLRAVTCGLALQQAMTPFAAVEMPGACGEPGRTSETLSLSLKAGVAAGPVRRFLVGDSQVQRLDLLAGATLDRMAQAEQAATQGEILVGPEAARQLGEQLSVAEWRESFGVVSGLAVHVPPAPWPELPPAALTLEQVRPFLLPPVYERLMAGQGEFLAELRPAVALFLRFGGLDYDGDDDAGPKLDAFVRWVQGVLGRCGGFLLQLTTGDKGSFLYAAFGALTAHEDDAARAVAAAMELRQPPPDLAFITGVQIGLSQGRVRAGAYGAQTRRAYGVIGDEVNVAARLMQAAPVGEIRCSQRVFQAAGGRWAFAALPPVQVKGKTEPLPVYRPLGRAGERTVRLAGALVGRRAEVATLTRLLAEVQSGQRRVLLLEGEAGIGKSRLVGELARLAREQGVAWLLGAGQSIEQRTPYRAWRDLLAAHFALDDPSTPLRAGPSTPLRAGPATPLRAGPASPAGQSLMDLAERQRRVRERVRDVNPALTERIPLLNDILRLDLPESDLTRGFDPKLRHESLTALVVGLLRATTVDGPLALVLEDAHWLDSLSWELALSVARALPDQPLLLVLALRPLEEPLRAEYIALVELEGAETLYVEAIPPEETVALAAARLGLTPAALPAEVADLVRERAGGNPFFAEELAYALRDSGAVVVEQGVCTLSGDPATSPSTGFAEHPERSERTGQSSGQALAVLRESVPDTVEGVVLSRIDRLPPQEQLTLKVAAVIGRSFLYRTLRDVHPQQVVKDLLRAYLDDLAWRELTPLEALEPELTYLFKHVITQQVAYDTLLFAQRRELHRSVAGWYERVYADSLGPYYPLLAHHWNRAEEVECERHYARLAGEQAAAQFANAEAVTYLSRALELTSKTDSAERYALLLAREKVYDLQGARDAQTQDLAALEELADALNDDRKRAEVAIRQANYAGVTGDYPAAIVAAEAGIGLAQVAQDVSSEAKGCLAWGRALYRQGDYEAARHRFEQALSLGEATGSRQVEADSLHNLGIVCYSQSDYAGARTYYEQALRINRATGNRLAESNALSNLGRVCTEQGDNVRARAYYEQALRISREIGNRLGECSALNSLGIVSAQQGDYAGARTCFEQTLHISREIGDRLYEGSVLLNLGEVSAEQGGYVEARAYYEQALRILREIGYRQGEAVMLSNMSLISHHLGNDQAALEYSQQAFLIAQELGDRYIQGCALTHLGHALVGLDRRSTLHPGPVEGGAPEPVEGGAPEPVEGGVPARLVEAADAYRQALNLRRELGQHSLAAETLAGLARVSLAQGELSQAQAQAEEILRHLETNTLDGTEEPLRIYLTCYRVLCDNQDARARDILNAAHSLLQERAARIYDDELRRSFLENVAAHREVVAAYQAMQAAE